MKRISDKTTGTVQKAMEENGEGISCESNDYQIGFTLSYATKALRESTIIALLYF